MKKKLVFFAVLILIFAMFAENLAGTLQSVSLSDVNDKINREVLELFSAVKASDVEKAIRDAEKKKAENISDDKRQKQIEETLRKLKTGEISFRKVFADTCFVGDSLLNGLEVYNILNSDRLITQVSARFDHLEDNINNIVTLNPEVLILHYGLNMLWADDLGIKWFIDDYSDLILRIKRGLPYTRIIVSSIFPVDKNVVTDELFTNIPKQNEALRQMCKDLGIEFLDSTKLVEASAEYYSPDGIHLNASFYSEKWLPFIVESKGIIG